MPHTRSTRKRPIRDPSDKKYHIHGKTFLHLVGTRKQVWLNSAYKTAGGLTRNQLAKNKSGLVVSKSKQQFEKKYGRLERAGYTACKGKFGRVKIIRGRTRGETRRLTCPSEFKPK